jgi:ABC-2 type transport system permease protein
MTTPPNGAPEPPVAPPVTAPPALPATRPLYWSIRRELWENRSIYVAPLAAAGVVLLGSFIRSFTLPHRMRALLALDPAQQRVAIITPFSMAAVLIMFTAVVVGFFYCVDALYGERRDRGILFWKSLPVSDLTTVLAKASIPLVVLPLLTFVVVAATQLILLVMTTAVLVVSGVGAGRLWSELPFFQMPFIQLYGLAVHALWHAPLYAWLLLVSAWARRTPFLWAVLPPLAIGALERIAFGTSHFGALVRYRVAGAFREAFAVEGRKSGLITGLSQLDPLGFFTSPGLWVGLAFAALFLAAVVRLRRRGEPI